MGTTLAVIASGSNQTVFHPESDNLTKQVRPPVQLESRRFLILTTALRPSTSSEPLQFDYFPPDLRHRPSYLRFELAARLLVLPQPLTHVHVQRQYTQRPQPSHLSGGHEFCFVIGSKVESEGLKDVTPLAEAGVDRICVAVEGEVARGIAGEG